jgi:hypothetical protein
MSNAASLLFVLVVERGRCERVSLAGTDAGETWSGGFAWRRCRQASARDRRRFAVSLRGGCRVALGFGQGVVDPGAKRRFWD